MILNRLIYLIGVSSIAVSLLFGCSNTANVGSDEIEIILQNRFTIEQNMKWQDRSR